MGCGTSNGIVVEETIESRRIKDLSYRHTVRMMRYMFDQFDNMLFKNQFDDLLELVQKIGDVIRDTVMLCQQRSEETTDYLHLKEHMKKWFVRNNREVGKLIDSASVQEGDDDIQRVTNTIKRLQDGEEPMRDALKTYNHEWFTTVCFVISPFQQVNIHFLEEVQEMIQIVFSIEKLPKSYCYNPKDYPQKEVQHYEV